MARIPYGSRIEDASVNVIYKDIDMGMLFGKSPETIVLFLDETK